MARFEMDEKQMALRTGSARRDAYNDQARKEGLSLSKWVMKHLDAVLPRAVANVLPIIERTGPKTTKAKRKSRKG